MSSPTKKSEDDISKKSQEVGRFALKRPIFGSCWSFKYKLILKMLSNTLQKVLSVPFDQIKWPFKVLALLFLATWNLESIPFMNSPTKKKSLEKTCSKRGQPFWFESVKDSCVLNCHQMLVNFPILWDSEHFIAFILHWSVFFCCRGAFPQSGRKINFRWISHHERLFTCQVGVIAFCLARRAWYLMALSPANVH